MCQNCGIKLVGGTGPAPSFIQRSGATSGDTFPFPHTIQYCKPSPGIWFNENDEPPRYGCNDFSPRNLDAYPLNDATLHDASTGNWKFGNSEMVLIFVKLENYPRNGGNLTMNFKNPNGQIFYTFTTALPIPNPDWTWWYAWSWGVVGHYNAASGFSQDEIIAPGNYRTEIITPFGSANVDYEITANPIPPNQITNLVYVGQEGQYSKFRVNLLSSTGGFLRTSVDDTIIGEAIPIIKNQYDVLLTLSEGPHRVCLGVLNGSTTDWVCVTVDISIKPIITNLLLTDLGHGNIKVSWTQDKPGFITITKNQQVVFTWNETTAGAKEWDSMNNQTGVHTFCVNDVCMAITITCQSNVYWCEIPKNGYEVNSCGVRRINHACDAPLPAFSLSADKTKTTTTGETVTLTTKGRDGEIQIFKKGLLGIGNVWVVTGIATGGTGTFIITPPNKKTVYGAVWKNWDNTEQWSNDVIINDDGWEQYLVYLPYLVGIWLTSQILGALRGR